MGNCCEKCFYNKYVIDYIRNNGQIGSCDYCDEQNVSKISTEILGAHFRKCFDKAYENIDVGTGAYYDSEEKDYLNRYGSSATRYSVIDILESEFVMDVSKTNLIEDLIKDSGPSSKAFTEGEDDPYKDIYCENFVIKNDLYGMYDTYPAISWDEFKFTIKHYNRFFDVDRRLHRNDNRKNLLEDLKGFILEYSIILEFNTSFYRIRKKENLDFDTLTIDKELAPAPPLYAQANRMSPPGISYLYLSSDIDTACKECRCNDVDIIAAKYELKRSLQIIDFSKNAKIGPDNIFTSDYNHDSRWYNDFLKNFASEISKPIDERRDRSYEYAPTQVIAEYIRSLGFQGICFNSSVGSGKSYCFFCGPILKYCKCDYEIYDNYQPYPLLTEFTDWFNIKTISLNHVSSKPTITSLNKTRTNN